MGSIARDRGLPLFISALYRRFDKNRGLGHTSLVWKAAKGLLSSKKALMAFVSAAVWLGGKVGLDLDASELLPAVGPMWSYILAQGAADFGKSKAEIESGDGRKAKDE